MTKPEEKQQNWLGKKEKNHFPIPTQELLPNDPTDYVHAEINLETIGFFRAGYKREYAKPGEAREVVLGLERSLRFVPSATYGYPNTQDLDYYRGLLKICEEQTNCIEMTDEKGRPHLQCERPQPIQFSTRKLIRYSGRPERASERRAVRGFIRRNATTGIHGMMRVKKPDGKTGYAEVIAEPWLRRAHIVGDQLDDGQKAAVNAIWFSEWFLQNYENRYLKLVDAAFHQRLGTPIAKALAPILDAGWFVTRGKSWRKTYVELAALLGIPTKDRFSHIKRQLDPSHNELQRERFLSRWSYSKINGGAAYVIEWLPGDKWFLDQKVYQERREKALQIASTDRVQESQLNKQLLSSHTNPRILTDEQQYLADDLIERLEDEKSRKNWENVIKAGDIPQDMLRGFASEAVYASKTGSLKKTKGAYAMDLVKRFRENRKAEQSGGVSPPSSFPNQSSNPPMRQNAAKAGLESGKNLAANAATNPANNAANVAKDSVTTEPENAANANAETPAA